MAITYIDENKVNDFDKKFEEKVGVNMEDYVLNFLKHQFHNEFHNRLVHRHYKSH